MVSDHSPLLPMPPTHRHFHFEDYWLRLDGFQDTVTIAWFSVDDANPFWCLLRYLQATARALTSWSAKTVGNIRHKMALSRELISRFDKAQEDRRTNN
jgi:hypothetical protein